MIVMVHSKILLQEAKELESLKDFIIARYEECKDRLSKIENFVGDHGEALEKERNVSDYNEGARREYS